jgi:cytochrome b
MKTNRQKSFWLLDALLFAGFLVSFALDWTGLSWHQWIGVFGGLLAFYHIVLHWDWFVAVTMRFFGKTSGQARTYYLLDISVLLGIYLIILTGLIISTWLDLPLTDYAGILDLHITISITTLAALVLKIGLHWRWIVRVARQPAFVPPIPAAQPVPVTNTNAMSRRDFLKLMGVVGLASAIAVSFTLDKDDTVQAASSSTTALDQSGQAVAQVAETATVESTATTVSPAQASTPAAAPTVVANNVTTAPVQQVPQSSVSTSCQVRCNRRCSYPGNCHRYRDTNANNLCDEGECT